MRRLFALIFIAFLTAAALAAPDYLVEPDPDPKTSAQIAAEMAKAFQQAAETAIAEAKPEPKQVAAKQPAPKGGRQLRVKAYAYCLRGLTASGTYVKPGTIAVDPRVIPLGTKLYVPGYGHGTALDTGGAIIGNTIDLWHPTSSQCYNWGVRYITITVYD